VQSGRYHPGIQAVSSGSGQQRSMPGPMPACCSYPAGQAPLTFAMAVGARVGAIVGAIVGALVGAIVGALVGARVGAAEGYLVGAGVAGGAGHGVVQAEPNISWPHDVDRVSYMDRMPASPGMLHWTHAKPMCPNP
jgi:hypothetical protein